MPLPLTVSCFIKMHGVARFPSSILVRPSQLIQGPPSVSIDCTFLPARRYADTSHGPVSVCLSMFIYDKSEFYQNGWTNRADLGIGASFHPSYTVLKGNSGISKKGYFPLELSPKLRTENFASVYRSRKRYQLRSRQVDAQKAWKLNRRRSTKLTISLSSYARPLLYHTNHQALSTLQHNSDARVN